MEKLVLVVIVKNLSFKVISWEVVISCIRIPVMSKVFMLKVALHTAHCTCTPRPSLPPAKLCPNAMQGCEVTAAHRQG